MNNLEQDPADHKGIDTNDYNTLDLNKELRRISKKTGRLRHRINRF